jgi:pimeloyl-ACP methyl ester carboxylesterase
MSFMTVNGLRFNVQQLGHGDRTVVFLHGLVMDNLSSWYYTLANPLAKQANVLLYDLRGHGLTQMTNSGYTLEQNLSDLVGILDTVGVRRPVYLVGNSFGGQLALAFARAHPERTAGLVLVEAHYAVEGWDENIIASFMSAGLGMHAPEVRAWLDGKSQRNHERRFRRAEYLMQETSLINDLCNSPLLLEDDLRAITQPVLALYGARSDVVARGRAMKRLMPRCELHVLRKGTHSILLENTGWVRERILDWFARQVPPRAEAGVSA